MSLLFLSLSDDHFVGQNFDQNFDFLLILQGKVGRKLRFFHQRSHLSPERFFKFDSARHVLSQRYGIDALRLNGVIGVTFWIEPVIDESHVSQII